MGNGALTMVLVHVPMDRAEEYIQTNENIDMRSKGTHNCYFVSDNLDFRSSEMLDRHDSC